MNLKICLISLNEMPFVAQTRPRIIVFDFDWETRRSILAGRSTGDPVLKGFPAD